MELSDLASDLLERARASGAEAADVLVVEGTDFKVTVRKGEIESLTDAGSKALGLRVFVGHRTATGHTSDFSRAALERLAEQAVAMARATAEDPAAGLPDRTPPPDDVDLGLHDASVAALTTETRIEWARRAEVAAFEISPEIINSQGASLACGEDTYVLANSLGFLGSYRATALSLSVVPVAERAGEMQRDYWYSTGRGVSDVLAPEAVGRVAAERTLRRLGSRRVPTCEAPVVFDPETAADLLGHVVSALSGYAVYRNATFLKDRVGDAIASPLVTIVDDGRRLRGLGSRPFDGEGLPTRRNVPVECGVLRHFLCDAYSARKIRAQPTGSARRGVAGGPTVGVGNASLAPGGSPPEEIIAGVPRGLYVTDLIGFGVNLVTGDYSQGAAGHWIENGRLAFPVHEVTIAGNLKQMLADIDAVGDDLVFRSAVASPTLRIRRMTISGQ